MEMADLVVASAGGNQVSPAQEFRNWRRHRLEGLGSWRLSAELGTATGLLQLSSGAVPVGSLQFEVAALGAGSFNVGNDGIGHVLLTRDRRGGSCRSTYLLSSNGSSVPSG
jgi:hypothetical protein